MQKLIFSHQKILLHFSKPGHCQNVIVKVMKQQERKHCFLECSLKVRILFCHQVDLTVASKTFARIWTYSWKVLFSFPGLGLSKAICKTDCCPRYSSPCYRYCLERSVLFDTNMVAGTVRIRLKTVSHCFRDFSFWFVF